MAIPETHSILAELSKAVDCLDKEVGSDLKKCYDDLETIYDTLLEIDESWSGSWLREYAEFYYLEFEKPPPNRRLNLRSRMISQIPHYWQERTYEDVESFVRKKHKEIKLDKIEARLSDIIEKARAIHSNIRSDLSFIRGLQKFDKEIDLLDSMETHVWGVSAEKLIEKEMPKTFITTYPQVPDLIAPPHIRYKAVVLRQMSRISAVEDFIEKAKRILRQIEVRMSTKDTLKTREPVENVMLILQRFHTVVQEMQRRRDKRDTLKINDEYDVQDLLRALLKVFFDDVRLEEWTPTYAGAASKMDFLLKQEGIVIETKFDLNDKDIGDQLLVDISRYREHPNCRTLICFVYDPRRAVRNPKGLERDLSKRSDDHLDIKVFVSQ